MLETLIEHQHQMDCSLSKQYEVQCIVQKYNSKEIM